MRLWKLFILVAVSLLGRSGNAYILYFDTDTGQKRLSCVEQNQKLAKKTCPRNVKLKEATCENTLCEMEKLDCPFLEDLREEYAEERKAQWLGYDTSSEGKEALEEAIEFESEQKVEGAPEQLKKLQGILKEIEIFNSELALLVQPQPHQEGKPAIKTEFWSKFCKDRSVQKPVVVAPQVDTSEETRRRLEGFYRRLDTLAAANRFATNAPYTTGEPHAVANRLVELEVRKQKAILHLERSSPNYRTLRTQFEALEKEAWSGVKDRIISIGGFASSYDGPDTKKAQSLSASTIEKIFSEAKQEIPEDLRTRVRFD